MATDVILDQVDGTYLELDARVILAHGSDFMLDSQNRRKGGGPFRRAMVHDQNDGLTINFARDYPGGVTLIDVRALQVGGDITFGRRRGIRSPTSPESSAMVPTSLNGTISALQSEIANLKADVAALLNK
jgi:hypothetical protein